MKECAFATGVPLSTPSTAKSAISARHTRKRAPRRQREHTSPKMLRPLQGNKAAEPPFSPEQLGPPEYKWDPEYPGTLKPGSVDDNYPLKKVLESDVYSRMKYDEMDIDEREPRVFAPDEDFLQWLAREGRLLPRGMTDDEFDTEAEKQMSGITEEDLEFADDDSKMIAYYSKQGEGSAVGAGSDFGGFSESSADSGPGF